MRSRVVFTAVALALAGVLGTAAGALLGDYGHAFVVTAVLALGVLTIGFLEWDHSRSVRPDHAVGAPESSAIAREAREEHTVRSPQPLPRNAAQLIR